jgi:hypothetical protein
VRSYLNPFTALWLCAECDDKGDWCKGCRNLIDDDGMCSPDCDYWMYSGVWGCNRCNTWREAEKYCGICGPDPADLTADDESEIDEQQVIIKLCRYSYYEDRDLGGIFCNIYTKVDTELFIESEPFQNPKSLSYNKIKRITLRNKNATIDFV